MRDSGRAHTAIRQRVRENIALKEVMLGDVFVEPLARLAAQVSTSARAGGKVVLFGNGGSAADATHVAAEFVGRFAFDREPMPALALSDNLSVVTAIANDYGYELTFARQLHALCHTGDVAIALSTSGSSANVLEGVRAARDKGAFTAAFTGANGSQLSALTDLSIMIPSEVTARIQEGYMLFAHIMCELVEQELFGADSGQSRLKPAA